VELVEGNTKSAIAIVHAFVENQGDGWAVTSAYLDRFIEEQRLLATNGHNNESEEQAPYLRYMAQAGRRAAELHLAFAGASELPDYIPEPIQPANVQQWVEDTTARANRVFDALEQQHGAIKEADRPLADQMRAQHATLRERLRALLPSDIDGLNIRQHGNFDLSRMLIVKDDIFIFGFEGDPRQPLDERRRKAPAARDVASLIRSIDYSATSALERALKLAPDDEQGKLGTAVAEWRDRAARAFVTAYREIMTNTRLWPADPQAADRLLDFFLLEKMLTEVEYELSQRPEWLRVPLNGILRILSPRPREAS
jgi:maltose alpha-D-glucosyltransferase/alpha-amylase